MISILSIMLIIDGVHAINSFINVIETMGGFDIYPIYSPDTIIQGWYYQIIANILFTLCSVIILVLSIISIFIQNRAIEISIITQTFLMLILALTANDNYREDIIGYYTLLAIALLVASIIIIISAIKKKSVFIFYILAMVLLVIKYIDVYRLWFYHARGSVSLLRWFDMYGIKYAIVAILGFCVVTLKPRKTE